MVSGSFFILPVVPCVESEKKISGKDLLKKRGESATKKKKTEAVLSAKEE